MASIHRRPNSKFWHAAWRDVSGRLHLRSTKQIERGKAQAVALEFERAEKKAGQGTLTEAQAREVLNDILARAGTDETIRCPTTATFLDEWIAGKEATKAAGTSARYKNVVETFKAHLGERARKPISSVTAHQVESYITKRLAAGLSPTTVTLDGKVLRTAFNKARRQGLVPTNPVEAVDLPGNASVERGTFTPAEVKMLVDAAEGEWKTLIQVGYYTGQRLCDCVRMAWGDISLTDGTWTLRQGKTDTKVLVPLHPALLAHLGTLAGVDTAAQFVMPGMAEKGPGGRHGLSESFKAIMRKAGVDHQPVERDIGVRTVSKRPFHALRHSFASELMNAGVAPEVRMKLTGHKTEAMHKVYSHVEVATLRDAVAKLPGLR